ncbi:MAG TPA: hypothetical protein VM029_12600 [Opitutaceae bacterium]|nr:hypothetical protein [Opitutaceae bacterium]
MKTLPAFAFIAALAASVLFPLNLALAGSILFGAGLLTIAISDYTRSLRPLGITAPARPAPMMAAPAERFRLAA